MRRMKDEYFAAIESFIDRYREEAGISPTLSEIADGTGIPRSTVPRYLAVMRESGVLDYSGHRGITTRRDRAAEEGIRVPVLGSVSCGLPKLAEENIEEYVTLPQALFGRGEMYILRASGESMIEAGIEDKGEHFDISRIIGVRRYCPCVVGCVAPIEYTVVVQGIEKKIYYEHDTNRWFSVREVR